MTAPSDFNSIPELDATLVFRVAYDGSSYSSLSRRRLRASCAALSRRSCAVRST